MARFKLALAKIQIEMPKEYLVYSNVTGKVIHILLLPCNETVCSQIH